MGKKNDVNQWMHGFFHHNFRRNPHPMDRFKGTSLPEIDGNCGSSHDSNFLLASYFIYFHQTNPLTKIKHTQQKTGKFGGNKNWVPSPPGLTKPLRWAARVLSPWLRLDRPCRRCLAESGFFRKPFWSLLLVNHLPSGYLLHSHGIDDL